MTKSYVALFGARFRTLLQYRAAALAGVFTQLAFGVVFLSVYEAFYASTERPQPMAFAEVVSYVWLVQALFALLPWNIDGEARDRIRTGAVVYDLTRPVDLYATWFVRAMAWRMAPTILRAVPVAFMAMVVLPLTGFEEWRLAPPPTLGAGAVFALALGCTLLLSGALTTLVNVSMLWTISIDGAATVFTLLVTLLSGMLVPLPLFPDWAQPVLMALPFAGLADVPFRIYSGDIGVSQAPAVLLRQVVWIGVLVLFGRWLMARGMRRLVAQGG
jgi:ABC-2 type transport system permease protein